jgi:ribonucleoside-diphosphate reductase alpha chain
MARPLERDAALAGFTYKLKWPGSDHAIYVTVNDIERDGRRRPFEIFINTKNLEHYAWTVALTRMISAVFRRGGDVAFVVEELKAVFDPQGGHWIAGRYVPSLLAAIGEVIETHMIRTGFLQPADRFGKVLETDLGEAEARLPGPAPRAEAAAQAPARPRFCPRCATPGLVREEGCWVCHSCGYSRCS